MQIDTGNIWIRLAQNETPQKTVHPQVSEVFRLGSINIGANGIDPDPVHEGRPKAVQSSSQVLPNSNWRPISRDCLYPF